MKIDRRTIPKHLRGLRDDQLHLLILLFKARL
jgi:hypothetical protein